MSYLGDFAEDAALHFIWDSFSAAGASITRATDGTISVYKDNGLTQSTAGITDTEDFDTLTGIHACTIDLSADAFYSTGSNYSVVLSAATIDGETVNAVLAHFSIENRWNEVVVTTNNDKTGYTASTVSDKTGYSITGLPADSVTAAALAADAGTEIAAAVGAFQVESVGTVTLQQALSVILAFAAGQTSGQDTSSPVFNAPASSTSRITGSTDGNGNRTVTAITPSS